MHLQVAFKSVLYLFASHMWLPALLAMFGGEVEKHTPGGYVLLGYYDSGGNLVRSRCVYFRMEINVNNISICEINEGSENRIKKSV